MQRACLSGALVWFKFRGNPAREWVGTSSATQHLGESITRARAENEEWRTKEEAVTLTRNGGSNSASPQSSRARIRGGHYIPLDSAFYLDEGPPIHPSIHPSSFQLTHPFASGRSASTLERPPGPSKHILINGPSTPHGIRTEEKNLTQNENSSKGIREIKKAQCSVVHCRS